MFLFNRAFYLVQKLRSVKEDVQCKWSEVHFHFPVAKGWGAIFAERMLSVLFSGTMGSFPDPRHEALSDIGSLPPSLCFSPAERQICTCFFLHSGTFKRLATFYYFILVQNMFGLEDTFYLAAGHWTGSKQRDIKGQHHVWQLIGCRIQHFHHWVEVSYVY